MCHTRVLWYLLLRLPARSTRTDTLFTSATLFHSGWLTPWGSVKVRSEKSGGAMLQRSQTSAGPSAMRGFTLVELMVTLAVLTIIAIIATPSFANLIRGNRLASSANEMVALLQTARSAAISNRASSAVCPSSDGVNCAASLGNRWIA